MSDADADGIMHSLLCLETTSTVQADVEANQEPPRSLSDLEKLKLKGSTVGHGDPSGLPTWSLSYFVSKARVPCMGCRPESSLEKHAL